MRFFPHVTLSAALLVSGPRPVSPPPSADEVSPVEYDVYAALLDEGGPIIPPDSTDLVICHATFVVDACRWPSADPMPEAWTSYVERGRRAAAIDPAALRQRGLKVVSRTARRDPHACGGPSWIGLSRVGFNHDSTEAIVRYSMSVGAGPYPGCGYAAGSLVRYWRKPGGKWKSKDVLSQWMT